jgi:hypothetical protein
MPGRDRTGPLGQGPMTGRGAGDCAGSETGGFSNQFPGVRRQFGGRFGRGGGGRGWRNGFRATGVPFWARSATAPPNAEQELAGLKDEAKFLQGQLDAITRRIDELGQK